MPLFFKLSAKEADEYLYTPSNTIVKYQRLLGFSYIQTHQLLRNPDDVSIRPVSGMCLSSVWIFPPLFAWKKKKLWGKTDKGKKGWGGENWLSCFIYVCIALQNIWRSIYGIMDNKEERTAFTPRGFFSPFCTNGSFLFTFFCCAGYDVAFGCQTYWKWSKM